MIVLLPNCAFLSGDLAHARPGGGALLRDRGAEVVLATRGGPYAGLLEQSDLDPCACAGSDDLDARRFLDAVLSMGITDDPSTRPASCARRSTPRSSCSRRRCPHRRHRLHAVGYSTRVAGIPLATSHGGSFVFRSSERGLAPVPVNPPRPEIAGCRAGCSDGWPTSSPPLTGSVAQPTRSRTSFRAERLPNLVSHACGDLTLVTSRPELLGIPEAELRSWRAWWPRAPGPGRRSAARVRCSPSFSTGAGAAARRHLPFAANPGAVYLSPTSVHEPFPGGPGALRAGRRRLCSCRPRSTT